VPAEFGAVPSFETERLRLRGWKPEDVPALARVLDHPEVTRYLHLPGFESPGDTVERLCRHWAQRGFGHWAVEERASGELIGRLGLLHHRDWTLDPENVEVGWVLARAAWGRGLATEGGRAALRYGFERLGVPRIISIADPANRASRRVMEKLGLTLGGAARWRGVDVVWYSIERPAWMIGSAAARARVS
jgi:RimJ/RimL family protein N-acetyltransferase